MDKAEITAALKATAEGLGFVLAGVCSAAGPPGWERYLEWLGRGYAGEMEYLASRREAYRNLELVLPGVRSLLMLAFPYRTSEPLAPATGEGRMSRYAWGEADYHDVIHDRLKTLRGWLQELVPGSAARGVVDSAPLFERQFAERAGLGWIGKNTLLLNKYQGSWFFLAALLTDIELEFDTATESDHCGSCRLCLEACPTQAFPEPYVLDATRCISYLTIELRGAVPEELRTGLGDWIFGCDVCQEVCPWNRKAPLGPVELFGPRSGQNPVPLARLFDLDEQQFREEFRRTPLWRARRSGLLRNAAIALGNSPDPKHLTPLSRGLNDDDDVVRGACAWALGRMGTPAAREMLQRRREVETSAAVLDEIANALATA